MRASRPFRVTATNTAFDSGNSGVESTMVGARLVAAAAVATAVIRETDGSGAILCELSAAVNTSDESVISVLFRQKIHVTLAGAGATAMVYVA